MMEFPKDTWRRVIVDTSPEGTEHYYWYLFDRVFGVHFHFSMRDGKYQDCSAGIECHYMAHEDNDTIPCDISPTGFCKCEGTSLWGENLYFSSHGGKDVDMIWGKLIEWFNNRRHEPHYTERSAEVDA